MDITQRLSQELHIPLKSAAAAVELIDEGNTIPFIARYRKERTGNLDDQLLRQLSDRLEYLRGLDSRRAEVGQAIGRQGLMTAALQAQIDAATTLTELEDLYRPYRPKRRTRASIAREKGLEPLADCIFTGRRPAGSDGPDLERVALAFTAPQNTAENALDTVQAAIAGAMDIVAEQISDSAQVRHALRELLLSGAALCCQGKEGCQESVYRTYQDFSQPLQRLAGHQVLAIDRGEKAGLLKVSLQFDRPRALGALQRCLPGRHPYSSYLYRAAEDAFDRLILPSVTREIRSQLTERAVEGAINLFGQNLKQLLMQPPVRQMVTMGFDPAYRTGCKIAVVDDTGKVLATTVVYPTPPQKKTRQAAETLLDLISKHGVRAIAIGNGTASKESEIFVADLIRENKLDVSYLVVSEAGASVYSASKLAAEEFPQYDVSLRSAISIARRLQDPLAELVKIDPKSIGVGQYQHDMPAAQLDHALDGVVEDCVNAVGVDLNTASPSLLRRVAGLSPVVAKNIVAFREENGAFTSRTQLKKVKGLGPKAFSQAAGFLRLDPAAAKDPLDTTAVHPESYPAAKKLLALCGYSKKDLLHGDLSQLRQRAAELGSQALQRETGAGDYTLQDMIDELLTPGRDPRDELPPPLLRSDLMDIADLKPGMQLQGTVRNVIDFGAFVDIGVHQDGLVHISRLSKSFVKHPLDVVKVGDIVTVWVLEVDTGRGRISLSMVGPD
ncbi:RNA-binding transcriptional accessory protein [Neobittarella massiliensis]|uniref:RNA-binding transcriptional accessory protein n=1 Tax=Neobittarella massiliensis (ex Bilen et al. 2018) TaxID=2041842 RepID=A0A8J6IPQ5_9FIRM|nr:Tex family protein [Neobittarella massiliensis]MBC3516562.1 RNA-binding transcriptional accessory protein [Neobittarella massiliensis]